MSWLRDWNSLQSKTKFEQVRLTLNASDLGEMKYFAVGTCKQGRNSGGDVTLDHFAMSFDK